jgi:hypothetical protein
MTTEKAVKHPLARVSEIMGLMRQWTAQRTVDQVLAGVGLNAAHIKALRDQGFVA